MLGQRIAAVRWVYSQSYPAKPASMAKIILIEDDSYLAASIADMLELRGHRVEVVGDGEDGLHCLKSYGYDLAIIDWQLPGISGDQICQAYRIGGGKAPILMLTSKSSESDKVAGLDAGADDYLAKPFGAQELTARVRALLRRSAGFFADEVQSGALRLDSAARTATVHDRTTKLQPTEYALLEFLMRHPHTHFTTEQLLSHVWRDSAEVSSEALRTCIKKIRRKLDEPGQPSIIECNKGWGYRLSDSVLSKSETDK